MKPYLPLVLGLSVTCLSACSSSAPPAPIGLDKRPANTPETVASLLVTGDHTLAPDVLPPATVAEAAKPEQPSTSLASAPFVISNFAARGGIQALPADERAQLVTSARSAASVVLLVRGDHVRPSKANWNRLLLRGVAVKRYLVSQGVEARKVRIFVRSAGEFVAQNTTGEGRAKNRRVEIHINQVDHGQRT